MMGFNNIMSAPLPTLERFKSLFLKGDSLSVTRTLQYEALAGKDMTGHVLDFGGGDNARYKHLVRCTSYDSINIDEEMKPTWITNVGENFPCPDNTYDYVLSMNTFEHIYDVLPIIKDIHKSLKSGGEFVCSVPFLYPVHGHPDDFFRPTSSWWSKTLSDAGFKDIKIMPLLWGPFSTGMVCSGLPGPLKRLRTYFALLLDLAYVRLRFGTESTHFSGKLGETMQNHALGYFIQARK